MSKIQKLSEHVINQIKAGEVIERPFNVVKEILENAIDAHSSEILIELIDGGKQLIRITDNGSGMEQEDLLLCLERHATSKLQTAEDLLKIQTFGFRGEALASIAAISQFSIKSRPQHSPTGFEIKAYNGEQSSPQATAMNPGTSVSIQDLFGNIPVRKKFLRSTSTEYSHIYDFIHATVLQNFKIGFTLIHNGRTIFQCPPTTSMLQRFEDFHGKEAQQYIEVNYERGSFRMEGFLMLPEHCQASSQNFITLVNQRYVKDKVVRAGLTQGYTNLLTKGQAPSAIIFLSMDPLWVDVNAHPAKSEVRFKDPDTIQELMFLAIQNTLKNHLKTKDAIPSLPTPHPPPPPLKPLFESSSPKESSQISPSKPVWKPLESSQPSEKLPHKNIPISKSTPQHPHAPQEKILEPSTPLHKEPLHKEPLHKEPLHRESILEEEIQASPLKEEQYQEKELPKRPFFNENPPSPKTSSKPSSQEENSLFLPQEEKKKKPSFQYLGQYASCYLMIEIEDELWFIDQHAFHERLLFEKWTLEFQKNGFNTQSLLVPITLQQPSFVVALLEEKKEILQKIGFEVEFLNEETIALAGIPSFLEKKHLGHIFDELICRLIADSDFQSPEFHPLLQKAKYLEDPLMSSSSLEGIYDHLLATMACHSAIRSGETLTSSQALSLIEEASFDLFYSHCPHGRPVIRKWKKKEIESWFLRV